LKRLCILILICSTLLSAKHKEIIVDLHKQWAYALEDGNIIFQGRISSGKRGRATPEGSYTVLQKNAIIVQTFGLNQMVEQKCHTC